MDKLSEYLAQHRPDLDVDTPPDRLWQSIQASTKRQPEKRVYRMASRAAAAAVLVLVCAGLWLASTKDNDQQAALAPEKKPAPRKEALAPVAKQTTRAKAPVQEAPPQKPTNKTARKKRTAPPEEPVGTESLVDKSYARLINDQLTRLRSTPVYAESADYFNGFVLQLNQMQADEQTLQRDMARYGLTNELLAQLIYVYQQKLTLLKKLQTEIGKMNRAVKADSSAGSSQAYYLNL